MPRTNVSASEARIVYLNSGNVCAFPGCGKRLIEAGTATDDPAFIGEIAHIVADSHQGPRGACPLTAKERDKHPNLILLCGDHHTVIDRQPLTYTVSVLRKMKADHEGRVRKAVSPANPEPPTELKKETIHSSLLAVTHLPQAVFSAPCRFRQGQEDEVRERTRHPDDRDELVRYILRDGMLYSFHDLRDPAGPFAEVINPNEAGPPCRATELWEDAEGHRRYLDLLNRAMFKHAARLGVRYDPTHRRYYFEADGASKECSVWYRPLNARRRKKRVVWQPKRRSTGEGKGFWWHLAAGIRFHRVGKRQWCLSLRPERHLTTDGVTPLAPERVGRRVTRLKARMYNEPYLREVNFWRDYLSGGKPRILLNFGQQSVIIDTRLLTFRVEWHGIPDDDKAFKNQAYPDDLFTLSDFSRAIDGEHPDWDGEDHDEEPE